MPYYLIGIYINSKNIKNEKYISNILLISIILVLCVSTVLETMVLTKFNKISYFENFVSTIFLSVFVMIFAIQNPGKNSLISKLGRECAVYIYILQMAIGGVLKVLYPSCTISTILIFVIGILISIIYIKIKSITLKLRREKK